MVHLCSVPEGVLGSGMPWGLSQQVALSHAGASAVLRCKFTLSLVRRGGGLEGRWILQRSLEPTRCSVDGGPCVCGQQGPIASS